jgi:DNA invertase Pin-like site-specific DNA recombinase
MDTNHLRAAIYARVSSEQQANEYKIVRQIEAIRQRVLNDELVILPSSIDW